MSKYQMSDGTVVITENATQSWEEDTRWDGHNNVSLATGSQWAHETLYRSRKGRYYVEHISQWEGTAPSAEWVSMEEAARWLLTNNEQLPEDLKKFEESITE